MKLKKVLSALIAVAITASAVAQTISASSQQVMQTYQPEPVSSDAQIQTSTDGRARVKDSMLIVDSGSGVTYHSRQSFSGDYTIEMRASLHKQALGLQFGNGTPYPPMWSYANIDPSGIWLHKPGYWNDVKKIPTDVVKLDTMVTMRIEIKGETIKTYLNGEFFKETTLPKQNLSGPLGLRFDVNESSKVDYVRVEQDGAVIWEDDFNYLDNGKWDFPASLESCMNPVWEGNTVEDESLWPIANSDGSLDDLPLLYHAEEILSVTNTEKTRLYQPGVDYDLVGGKLRVLPGSSIPVTDYASYHPSSGPIESDEGGAIYYPGENAQILQKQISVTYRHTDSWTMDKPQNKSNLLPKTMERLENRQRVNISYYGDNITEGYNVSGMFGVSPNMPCWANLVTKSIQKAYPRTKINGFNKPDPGLDSIWGLENIESRVIGDAPDLVVIAFGINDGSFRYTADAYVANLQGMMDKVKASNPDCEFLLVTSTLPNAHAPHFSGNHEEHSAALLSRLEGQGVAVVDMTQLHRDLLTKKNYADMTGNNVNRPNDFLARCYAQAIFETAIGDNCQEAVQMTDLSYVDGSTDEEQTLDIELPETGSGPFPVVMFVHGGAWVIGSKTDIDMRPNLDRALENGYAVVTINYRLAQHAPWPAQIYDCKAAVRFLRANAKKYDLNPDQICAWGSSAGGHLVQMMGTTNGDPRYEDLSMGNAGTSSNVQAVISISGISDVSKWETNGSLNGLTPTGKDPTELLLGDGYTEEEAYEASAISHVSENTVPMLLAHGRNDTLVPFDQSQTMYNKLKEYLDTELIDTCFLDNGPHGDIGLWNSQEPAQKIFAFLHKRFRPYELLDSPENEHPGYWTTDIAGYPNVKIGLQYATVSPTQKLSLLLPEEGEGPFPLIVFIHGGGFEGGNSSGSNLLYTVEGPLKALKAGYAVAAVDYRMYPEATFPKPVQDIKAAIRYLRANAGEFGIDPYNFAIWGESAGGNLVEQVGLTNGNPDYEDLSMGNPAVSSDVQAVVSWYGIADLTTEFNAQYCRAALGGSQQQMLELAKKASPVNQVTSEAPPFYLQHGLADTAVEWQDSQRLYDLLQENAGDKNHKLDLFPGIDHAKKKFISQENVDRIVPWLDSVLTNAAPDLQPLRSAVKAAEAIDLTICFPDGQQAFTDALAAAKALLEQPAPSAQEVNDLLNELNAAADALIFRADKAPLTDALEKVGQPDLHRYTQESAQAFRTALNTVNRYLGDETLTSKENQAILDAASALISAYNSLVPVTSPTSDKSILEQVSRYAERVMESEEYAQAIEQVQISFAQALHTAQLLLADQDASQAEIDSAWIALMNEIHKLGFAQGDKTQLKTLVSWARTLDLERYVTKGQDEFLVALEQAVLVSSDKNAMQAEVDAACDQLLSTMMNLRMKADKSVLEAVLADAAKINTSLYTAESVKNFNAANDTAKVVGDNPQATQTEVDGAAKALQNAINELKPINASVPDATVQGDKKVTTGNGSAKTGETTRAAVAVSLLSLVGAGLILSRKKK